MSEYTIQFEAPPMSAERLPDGSTVIYDARIVSPERWAGQVRDVIVWADGSIHLGADHGPTATSVAVQDDEPRTKSE